jgi:uncharacterized protein YlxW (UPF0749 family)
MTKSLRLLSMVCYVLLLFCKTATSQEPGGYEIVLDYPDKLFKEIDSKSASINELLVKQTEKYLARLAREEAKLKSMLAKKDSSAAARIFGDATSQYADFESRFRNGSGNFDKFRKRYIPHLDTIQTVLNFLDKAEAKFFSAPGTKGKIYNALNKIDVLQGSFNQADEIKKYLRHRRDYLQQQLDQFGLAKEFKKFKKEVYYYQAQVEEYKNMLDDPSKIEAKVIALLQETSVFKKFFANNSQLASLFRLAGSSSIPASSSVTSASLAGLQTRDAIQEEMIQRFGSAMNVQQAVQQQVPDAQQQLRQFKNRINSLGGGSSDEEMLDFKPNNQKTKTFKSRLEFGSNLQTVKANRFFPSTTDIGLSLGYKLNDKSIIGVGASYKMGWGKDIHHIAITHQGVGFRSFLDFKLKGSFWMTAGSEMNYRNRIDNMDILKDYSAWQKSALVGLSKHYAIGRKFKGNLQLMYDFMYKQHIPISQPILFRVGYKL